MKFATILATLLIPCAAQAERFIDYPMNTICQTTEFVVRAISEHKETINFTATEDSGSVIIFWVNKDAKTYTLTKTTKDGKNSCILSYGKVDDRI